MVGRGTSTRDPLPKRGRGVVQCDTLCATKTDPFFLFTLFAYLSLIAVG